MFRITKGLKESTLLWAKQKNKLLAFSLGWSILIAASFYFSYIYGFLVLAIIFVFLPLEFSFALIARKITENRTVDNQDFYVGFKAFMTSLVLSSKLMLKGFLWALLTGFVLALIGSAIVLMVAAPEIMQLTNYEQIVEAMLNNVDLVNGLTLVSLVSFALAGVIYNLTSYRGQMTPYILFDTNYSVDISKKMSESYTQKDKKIIIQSKLVFYAYYLACTIIGILIAYLFKQNNILNEQFSAFLGFLIAALLIAPIRMLGAIYFSYFYQTKYHEEIRTKFQAFINQELQSSREQFIKQMQEEEKNKKSSESQDQDKNKDEK